MTDFLERARDSYDRVAESYASFVRPRFAADAVGRGMLGAFAELVTGPVADVGCGPGHVTAHLDGLGTDVFGVDLSPEMVAVARRTYPHLRFDVGSMTALDLPDGELGGIVAWWSIFHVPPAVLPAVLAGFARTLAPDGHLLIGFHAGNAQLHPEAAYGQPVNYDAYLLPPDHVAKLLKRAGFDLTARVDLAGTKHPQAILLARKGTAARSPMPHS
ncbi:SAM-dependent methyltransferase [Amycolatopsis endophytica]|uniref:SAM-dependent methyltransferase n=1 Tax=Amycolatopsis endophytica TaxID=860233 RepID=A0A853B2R1_9PSEU|nr:class I SAM-dependent methyltransferase [Amycolatopsis endophytica]NYI89408.1 SAM-dependent methyltransferase [Amycolatopsis endophytica]